MFFFQRFNAFKHHWSDSRVPVILEVNQGSLDQIDPATNKILCSYDYKDMEGLIQVTYIVSEVSDCCLMPTQQFFSYIMARTS